ncbi:CPBP family intramembrane glutamic endopeptidase [Pueribacillus sp. YX66]|uniref:CPBP family intramembrane glutamic endopeptidase n=1 Tax=Pueribacillus sp. YX66 TaxID=3229242 RepID=UPI00358D4C89
MRKQYWWILVIYILMQLSGIVGLPLLYMLGLTESLISFQGFALWNLISFTVALIPILILTNRTKEYPFKEDERSPFGISIGWMIFGVFLAFFVQGIAGAIEMALFKVEPGSENTEQLVDIALSFPAFFLVFIVIGPILEEIVFRKIIFGALYTRFNFWISVFISSLIFGIVHGELEHLLIYTSMGATFAFLYIKTKRLIVPIIAHILMNASATLVALNYDKLEKLEKNLEQIQQFIGGF